MEERKTVFQIDRKDNVATALAEIQEGESALILGDHEGQELQIYALENIPRGHKIAIKEIAAGEEILKYGVVIGRATKNIGKGSWVHLHVMHSVYDERSSHLDAKTGAPMDTRYE